MTAPTTYEIGAALGSIATMVSQGIPEPECEFIDYPDSVKRADGLFQPIGFPQTNHHYGYLTSAQFDALKAFCPNTSAEVCIATENNDREFVRYNCVMKMPDKYVIRNGRYLDVTIEYSRLVAAE